MVNLSGMFDKAKHFATEGSQKAKKYAADNSGSIHGGLDKVEHVINDKTQGKYAGKLTKGRDQLTKALGVPGETRDGYGGEASTPTQTPQDVRTDPVEPSGPIDPTSPVDPREPGRDDGLPH